MVQGEYPNVQLGSYPNVSIVTNHSVKVSLESDDREQVEMVILVGGIHVTQLH